MTNPVSHAHRPSRSGPPQQFFREPNIVAGFVLAAVLTLLAPASVRADQLDDVSGLTQNQFSILASDLGSAFSVRGFSAGASVGLAGVDVGVGVGLSKVGNRSIWRAASSSDVPSNLPITTLRVQTGLPYDVTIGGHYAIAHGTNLNLIGVNARWAFVKEQLTTPGVSLGAAYSRLTGADALSFDTVGLNVTVAKNLPALTPYAGVGRVFTRTKPRNAPGLSAVSNQHTSLFAGVRLTALFNLVVEVERIGDITTYGVTYGLHF